MSLGYRGGGDLFEGVPESRVNVVGCGLKLRAGVRQLLEKVLHVAVSGMAEDVGGYL